MVPLKMLSGSQGVYLSVSQRTPRRGTDENGESGWSERTTGTKRTMEDRRSERRRIRARSSRPSRLVWRLRFYLGPASGTQAKPISWLYSFVHTRKTFCNKILKQSFLLNNVI